jgi:hypothetical protein
MRSARKRREQPEVGSTVSVFARFGRKRIQADGTLLRRTRTDIEVSWPENVNMRLQGRWPHGPAMDRRMTLRRYRNVVVPFDEKMEYLAQTQLRRRRRGRLSRRRSL